MLFRNNTRDLMRNRDRRMRLTEESYLDRADSIDDLYDKFTSFRKSHDKEKEEEFISAIRDRYGKGGVKTFYAYYRMKTYYQIQILDMDDVDLDKGEEKGAIEFLRDFGVKKIVLSGNSTANNRLSWEFIQNGCKLKGMGLVGDNPAFMFDIMN